MSRIIQSRPPQGQLGPAPTTFGGHETTEAANRARTQLVWQCGPVATWSEFAEQAPDLAAFGQERLSLAPAYLATVRGNGAPRVHPVSPIVGAGRLFVFMEPTSPKGDDLRVRRWYALHNGVPDTVGTGGEFTVYGNGRPVDDPDLRRAACEAATYQPEDRYVLFELGVDEARAHTYGDVPLPDPRRWARP